MRKRRRKSKSYTSPRVNDLSRSRAREVVAFIAAEVGVDLDDVTSYSRSFPVPVVRQSAAYALHINAGLSTPEIAKLLGYRDHSTALHGIRKCRYAILDHENARDTGANILDARREILVRAIRAGLAISQRLWGGSKRPLVPALCAMGAPSLVPAILADFALLAERK